MHELQEEHRRELPISATEAIRRIARMAEAWNGEWQRQDTHSGRLGLPVVAGLRRGWVAGVVSAEDRGESCHVVYRVDAGEYLVDRASVAILIIAGLGGLVSLVAPFVPKMLPLVPIGIFLALGAWLLIVARLRNSGPEEFFQQVEHD